MIIDSPIGEIRVFLDGNSVTEVLLPGWQSDIQPKSETDPKYANKVEQAFYKYFDCDSAKKAKVAYSDLVDVCFPKEKTFDAPGFHQKVYKALIEDVKTGTTISYGELAELAGNPKAARAVGTAMRKNPLPIVVPCHRVVQSSGALGGYMGTGDEGLKMKRWLLRHEGVNLKNVQ